jgi:hypothetical protein
MKNLSIFRAFLIAISCAVVGTHPLSAQAVQQTKGDFQDKFRQLDPEDHLYEQFARYPDLSLADVGSK